MSTALYTNSKFYGHELLQIAESVALEKGLEREVILAAMEGAIQKAAKSIYGHEYDIRVSINPKNGEISIKKCITIVEEMVNEYIEISIDAAIKYDQNAKVGDIISEELPPIEFGRSSALVGRQVVMQKFREAEREKQYEEFKDKVGTIVSGIVKRAEYNSVTIDVSRTEAIIKRDQLIAKENFRVGDRVRAYIVDVSKETSGPQVFLSRTHPQFLVQLFMQEVPEIYDGIIEVKSAARDPGSRAKMAVYSKDSSIDPIGACVGVRGSRVQAIVQELQGEKIDIILWSNDIATFAVNALAPAEVTKVIIDEEGKTFEVTVPDDQLSLAIGRRGQNVRLASQLINYGIDVISESSDNERKKELYSSQSNMFMEALECDEMIARLLVSEGFSQIEEIAYGDISDFTSIEGFTEDVAVELQNRARNHLIKTEKYADEKLKNYAIDDGLDDFEFLDKKQKLTLCEKGINSLDKLADLDTDELLQVFPELSYHLAGELIMAARSHWFGDENTAEN